MGRFILALILNLILLLFLIIYQHFSPNVQMIWIFTAILFVLSVWMLVYCNKKLPTDLFVVSFVLAFLNFGIIITLNKLYERNCLDKTYSVVYAELKKTFMPHKSPTRYTYKYHEGEVTTTSIRNHLNHYTLFQSVLLELSPYAEVLSSITSDFEKRKFKYPVEYRNNLEYGNDSYDYCFIEPYTALNNFGLRCVTKTIEKSDTILYYRNLNPSIDSVAHRLADTLQTASNRALVGDSFAFLFHDGIYSKEQVFDEIPQAKEYYLKYCKETDSTTNIISDTTTITPK